MKRYTWLEFDKAVIGLSLDIYKSGFKPNTIIGIQRGGIPLAVSLSHTLNCGLAIVHTKVPDPFAHLEIDWQKPILVVDDINDTGTTFHEIKGHIQDYTWGWSSLHKSSEIKYACLINNISSNFQEIDYSAEEINKLEDPSWVIFPWEEPFNTK